MSLVEVGPVVPSVVPALGLALGEELGLDVAVAWAGACAFFAFFLSLPSRAGGRFLPDGLLVALDFDGLALGGRITPDPGDEDGVDCGVVGGVVVPVWGTCATRRNRSCA